MFKTFDINITKKIELEFNKHFQTIIKEFGGIFAGGTAHAMFHGKRMRDHLGDHSSSDLDIYFRSKEEYENAVKFISEKTKNLTVEVEKSITGLCHNVYLCESSVKIQLVGCLFGSPEEIITSFDFKNLEVCYFWDVKSLKYKCLSSKNAIDSKYLDIRHTRSPFLMHRVYKYIMYRGFLGITANSRKHITDWIIKASTGHYKENKDGCLDIYVDLLHNYGFVNLLKNTDIISDSDLVYIIGKIKEVNIDISIVSDMYGYSREIFKKTGTTDIVIQEMKKREIRNGSK